MAPSKSFFVDDSRTRLTLQIGPQPVQRDGDPAAGTDEKQDVHETPYPPGKIARQLYAPEVGDRRSMPDRRETPLMLVIEDRRHRATFPTSTDDTRNILALLLGGRREARDGLAVHAHDAGRIADHEDVGITINREVGEDMRAARPVRIQAQPYGCGRSL